MDYDRTLDKVDMVASLQSRKDKLEADLKKKNEELKKLCIEEAELTGTLPPETPLEAGESPPSFRRRVGTVYKYPENLVNKVKSKEEEDALELELATVSNFVKAVNGLASNATNKGMKHKYRAQQQQNLQRQQELEGRLRDLRQVSRCPPKQRKKPRPPLESEVDGGMAGESVNGVSLSPLQEKMFQQREASKHAAAPPGFSSLGTRYNSAPLHNYNHNSHRQVQPEAGYPSNWNYQQQHRNPHDQQGNKYRDCNNWYNTAPTSRYLGVGNKLEDEEREKSMRYRDRFGSLDRRRGGNQIVDTGEPELRHSPVHRMYPPGPPPPPTILLPNQTYPENSLMRTHSLGMMDHTSRKCKEKDWYETSLDAGPRPTPTPPPPPHTPSPALVLPPAHPPTHTSGSSTRSSEADPAEQVHMPVSQQLSFDTVVPFESPKNHTVVQAGMWQPYREVTKPFEMADFYKYSTKFRKNASGAPPVPQQKAPYQPPQPMTCQPLAAQETSSDIISPREKGSFTDGSLADAFSHEMLSWYQDSNAPQSRSATLV